MKLLFFCTGWGYEQVPLKDFFLQVKEAGYDGVELLLPADEKQRNEIAYWLQSLDLKLIVQNWQPYSRDLPQYLRLLKERLLFSAELNPLLINSHTGRDVFSETDNIRCLELAEEIGAKTGVMVVHETHRGRFAYSSAATAPYLEKLPWLKLNADFSHWCLVSESLLEDQQDILQTAIERSYHIHARIGHAQGAQVPDFRLPAFEKERTVFLQWWSRILLKARLEGKDFFTITPEFGPPPYMPVFPSSAEPVASQWDLNLAMKEWLQEHFSATYF